MRSSLRLAPEKRYLSSIKMPQRDRAGLVGIFTNRTPLQTPNTGTTSLTNITNALKYNNFPLQHRLMHNHPSGDPTPSGADMRMTRELVDIAKPLGIAIHDHIIVGRDGHASFRSLGLIDG